MVEYKSQIGKVLKDYNVGEIVSINDQSHGYANINFSVKTLSGNLFVRFCKQQNISNIEQEVLLMSVLRKNSFKTAYPIRKQDGEYITLVNKIPVIVYNYVEGELPGLSSAVVSEIAKAVAQLSVIEFPKELNKQNAISLDDCKQIIISDSFRRFLYEDVREDFLRSFNLLREKLEIPLPRGIVHGDVFPDNTLFIGESLNALIDFEEFAIDNLLFDVGMTINGFCFDGVGFDEVMFKTFVSDYNSVRRFTESEKELMVDYLCWGAVGMTSWHLHQLLYHKNKKQLERVRILLLRADWIARNRSYINSLLLSVI